MIRAANGNFANAAISADGKYIIGNRDEKNIDVWNIKPTKPTFLGTTVNDMFDFFMLFFYMAGIAAVVLFSIHKFLIKMMHGKG